MQCTGNHNLYVLDFIVSMLSFRQFPLFHCMSYCYKLLFVIWCLKVNIAKVVNPLAMVYQAYWLIWRHKSFLDTFMFHFPRAVSLVNFSICVQSRNQYLRKGSKNVKILVLCCRFWGYSKFTIFCEIKQSSSSVFT